MSHRSLINIARALVANPEVLGMHKPSMALREETAENMLSQLRAFVDDKGLEMDPEMLHMRRPRTCIITAARAYATKLADQVFEFEGKEGVRCVKDLNSGSPKHQK